MKIKRLEIRNIASVEKADIDFENGLNNPYSGDKATLFLISGDTGSGKSVILDCISMTLYGTTPRLMGVNGIRSNKFNTGEQSISLTDIRQYTRLGINSKDESFARLAFEGNDGKNYVSTFKLGMTTHKTLAEPKWMLEIENETILEKKNNVAPVIKEAVGLSYEQFSRMAMLAQGQFASFLTGGKDERERILEQLTSTERFSEYGKAISNIFKRKKHEKEIIETQLSAEAGHILSEERERELRDKQSADKKILEEWKRQLDLITDILNLRKSAEESRTSIKKAGDEISLIEKEKLTEKYIKDAQILKDWDSTSAEREMVAARQRNVTNLHNKINNIIAAIEKRLPVTDEELSGVTQITRDFIRAFKGDNESFEVQDEKFITIGKDTFKLASLRIENHENELNNLDDELREVLHHTTLQQLRKDAKSVSDTLKEIIDIVSAFESLKTDEDLLKETIQTENNLANSKEELSKELKDSEEKMNSAKKKHEEADERYATMHLSLSENFTKLRHKLMEENALTCPLCGQGVLCSDHWNQDDSVFLEVLSPLEQEKSQRKKDYDDSLTKYNSLLANYNKLKGELNILTANKVKSEKKLKKNQSECIKRLNSLGIQYSENYLIELDKKRNEVEKEEKNLETRIAKADKVQDKISDIGKKWNKFFSDLKSANDSLNETIVSYEEISVSLNESLQKSDMSIEAIIKLFDSENRIDEIRTKISEIEKNLAGYTHQIKIESDKLKKVSDRLKDIDNDPSSPLENQRDILDRQIDALLQESGSDATTLESNNEIKKRYEKLLKEAEKKQDEYLKWNKINSYFGGSRFRTLVQSYILKPLLHNANQYLERITDHYTLTCTDENEQLSILVLDRYNKNRVRSATVLSGGERFMISLALSLALSAMNKPGMNVDILFIDEGFGTLDAGSLNAVIDTLRRLPEIAGQNGRRVGVISHREELSDEIEVKIKVEKCGEGRSRVVVS